MTARAKRRDDARIVAKAAEKSGASTLDIVAELAATKRDLALVRDYCVTYKARCERVAMIFQFVTNTIIAGKIKEAQVAIRSAQNNDLKDAREVVANRAQALDLAVTCLERHDKLKDVGDALAQIKLLSPETFSGDSVPVVTAVAAHA